MEQNSSQHYKFFPYHLRSYSNFPSSILVSGTELSESEGPRDEMPEEGRSAANNISNEYLTLLLSTATPSAQAKKMDPTSHFYLDILHSKQYDDISTRSYTKCFSVYSKPVNRFQL